MASSQSDGLLYDLTSLTQWHEVKSLDDVQSNAILPQYQRPTSSLQGVIYLLYNLYRRRKSLLERRDALYWRHFQYPWKLVCHQALGGDGSLFYALVTSRGVEIHQMKSADVGPVPSGSNIEEGPVLLGESHSKKLSQAPLPVDPNPHWRLLNWSHDGSHLLVGHSSGQVQIFDRRCQLLVEIAPPYPDHMVAHHLISLMQQPDWGRQVDSTSEFNPLQGIYMLPGENDGPCTVVLIYCSGHITLLGLDPSTSRVTQARYLHLKHYVCDFLPTSHIHACDLQPTQRLLAVMLHVQTQHLPSNISPTLQHGVLLFRLSHFSATLQETEPEALLTPVACTKTDLEVLSRGMGLLRRLTSSLSQVFTPVVSGKIVKFSPNGQQLLLADSRDHCHILRLNQETDEATVQVRRLHLPSNMLKGEEQFTNPVLLEKVFNAPRRVFPFRSTTLRPSPKLLTMGWWNEDAVILLLENGALFIETLDYETLITSQQQPEWFSPFSTLAMVGRRCLVVFQTEAKLQRTTTASKSLLLSNASQQTESTSEWDVDYMVEAPWPMWLLYFFWAYLSWACRLFFENTILRGRFRSNRTATSRNSRNVEVAFHLTSFQETSPEALFHRKLLNEEYGEALNLARRYHLDENCVFQEQWRKSDMSNSAILDFLRKITKRAWVLEECTSQIPNKVNSMRALLDFGLQVTGVETFLRLGEDHEWSEYLISSLTSGTEDLDFTHTMSMREKEELLHAARRRHEEDLLRHVTRESLNPAQEQLLQKRHQLLTLNRLLNAYEEILGGPLRSMDRYDAHEFHKFRTSSPLDLALGYAKEGRFDALDILRSYFPEAMQAYWLLLLENIPETTSPRMYSFLLPGVRGTVDSHEGSGSCSTDANQMQDWCFTFSPPASAESLDVPVCDAVFQKDVSPEVLQQFRLLGRDPCPEDVIEKWYCHRALDLESMCNMPDLALELLVLGLEKCAGGKGDNMARIMSQLEELCLFVYQCRISSTGLQLRQLQNLTPLEKVRLLMSTTETEMFAKNVSRWLFPMLDKYEKEAPGLGKYLLREYILEDDSLQRIRQLLLAKKSRTLIHATFLENVFLARVTVDCLTNCDSQHGGWTTQVEEVLQMLPTLGYLDNAEKREIHERVSLIRHAIEVGRGLHKMDVSRSLRALLEGREKAHFVHVLVTEVLYKHATQSSGVSVQSLTTLLASLMPQMRDFLTGLHPQMVTRVMVECLLQSGRPTSIQLAAHFMDLTNSHSPPNAAEGQETSLLLNTKDSLQCITKSAAQYTNTAVHAQDEVIQLSIACLQLAPRRSLEQYASVERDWLLENDLIDAFTLMDELGATSIMPIQIRNSPNPRAMLMQVMEMHPETFKKVDLILQLAEKLAIVKNRYGGVEKKLSRLEGRLCILEVALKKKHSALAFECCSILLEAKYQPAWSAFVQFVTRAELWTDKADSFRQELKERVLSFVISVCPEKEIPQCLDVLVNHITTNVSHHTLRSVESLHTSAAAADVISVHDFYEPRIDVEYGKVEDKNLLTACRMFHSACLSTYRRGRGTTSNANAEEDMERLKEVISHAMLKEDTMLAISTAVSLRSPDAFRNFVATFPTTHEGQALVVYAIMTRLGLKALPSSEELDTQPRYQLLKQYLDSFEDAVLRWKIAVFSPTLNMVRFLQDANYRRDSLLGLCLSDDLEQIRVTLHATARYQLPLQEAYFTVLEYLMLDSEKSANDLRQVLSLSGTSQFLLTLPLDEVSAKLQSIYEAMQGTDMERIQVFFQTFQAMEGLHFRDIPLSVHVKAVEKVKKMTPQMDYKTLISGRGETALDAMRPHLSRENVPMLAKMTTIFKRDGQPGLITGSDVALAWWKKDFFQVPAADIPESGAAAKRFWLNRLKDRKDILCGLSPRHFNQSLDYLLFSEDSKILSAEQRKDMVDLIVKLLKHLAAKDTRQTSPGLVGEVCTWQDLVERMNGLAKHLNGPLQELLKQLDQTGVTVPSKARSGLYALTPDCDFVLEALLLLLQEGVEVVHVQRLVPAFANQSQVEKALEVTLLLLLNEPKKLADFLRECKDHNLSMDFVHKVVNRQESTPLFNSSDPRVIFTSSCELLSHLSKEDQEVLTLQSCVALLDHIEASVLETGMLATLKESQCVEDLAQCLRSCEAFHRDSVALEVVYFLCRLVHTLAPSVELWRHWCQVATSTTSAREKAIERVREDLSPAVHRPLEMKLCRVFLDICIAIEPDSTFPQLMKMALGAKNKEALEHLASVSANIDNSLPNSTLLQEIIKGGHVHLFVASAALYPHLVKVMLSEPGLRHFLPGIIKQLTPKFPLEAAFLRAKLENLHPLFHACYFMQRR